MLKKELIGPGLHLRPVYADHARPPSQWTLNSVFSAYVFLPGHSRRKTDIWLLWQQWGLELPSFEPATKGTFFLLEVILLAGA